MKTETKREKELREKLRKQVDPILCSNNARYITAKVVNAVIDLLKAEGIIGDPPPDLTIVRDELRRGGQ